VQYPKHSIAQLYEETLEADGLSFESFKSPSKEFHLSGGYRKIFSYPRNVESRIFRYNDPIAQLTHSDIDKLEGKLESESVDGGKLKALRIEFSLDSSTYATMCLRELLKHNTSSSYYKKKRHKNSAGIDTASAASADSKSITDADTAHPIGANTTSSN